MKKQIWLPAISLFLLTTSSLSYSQNSADALRYSRIFYQGTARFTAVGGAFGAVGADFSTLSTNPAGIGLYRKSELTISPSGWISSNSSLYSGLNTKENTGNFAIGDAGVVFAIPTSHQARSRVKYFNFGFGLNRQNDFNSQLNMMGSNKSSSLMTDWVNIINSQHLTPDNVDNQYPYDIGLAHRTDLIYLLTPADSAALHYRADAEKGGVFQQKRVDTWGSINEMEFSLGGNYNDLIYFGATVGIPFIRYFEDNQYWENDQGDSIPFFSSLYYHQWIETHGTGINFKAGVIVRPANWVRIGATIHTPTYYGNMRDNWGSNMSALYDSIIPSRTLSSPGGFYDYNLTTPFRAIGSVAFFLKQFGFFSAEYEYVNYNQARLNNDVYSNEFTDVNDQIKSKYTSPLILRFGTEWWLSDFKIRGGFSYSGSPYKNSSNNNGERYGVSGGIGYHGKFFFIDLAYIWSQMKQEYYFYDSNLVDPSLNTLTSHSIVGTFGVKF